MFEKTNQIHSKWFIASLVVLVGASIFYTQWHIWPIVIDLADSNIGILAALIIEFFAAVVWYLQIRLWGFVYTLMLILILSYGSVYPILENMNQAETNKKILDIDLHDHKLLEKIVTNNNEKKNFPSLVANQYKKQRAQSQQLKKLILENSKLEFRLHKKVKLALQLLIIFMIMLIQIKLLSIISTYYRRKFQEKVEIPETEQERGLPQVNLPIKNDPNHQEAVDILQRYDNFKRKKNYKTDKEAAEVLGLSTSSRISDLRNRVYKVEDKIHISPKQMEDLDYALQSKGF